MKKNLIDFFRGILVVVMLLKLSFILDLPQKEILTILTLEMNETESEESQKPDVDEDEFIELTFNWGHSHHPFSVDRMIFLICNPEARIKEIISPPPQV